LTRLPRRGWNQRDLELEPEQRSCLVDRRRSSLQRSRDPSETLDLPSSVFDDHPHHLHVEDTVGRRACMPVSYELSVLR